MLDNAAAYTNTSGSFPDVLAVNASGPSATDGTEFVANLINDNEWGIWQMMLSHAGLTPNGVVESASGTSQIKEALQKGFGVPPGVVTEWNLASDPGTTGHRCLLLNGQGVLRASYPDLDSACYVGDGNNAAVAAAGGAYFRADNSDGSSPNIAGIYLILPESRGVTVRGLDAAATIDPDGASRYVGDLQLDAFQGWQLGVNQDDSGARTAYFRASLRDYVVTGAAVAGYTLPAMQTTAQGDVRGGYPLNDGTNGTPRTSSETRMYNRSTRFVVWY